MDKTFTIEQVAKTFKDWSSQYGQMRSYTVKLKEWEKPVTLNQKVDSPEPKEGDTLTGSVEPDTFSGGYKFKKSYTPRAAGAPGAPGSGGTRQVSKTPEEQNAIRKMNALNNAAAVEGQGTDVNTVLATAELFYEWLLGGKADKTEAEPTKDELDGLFQ